MSGTRSAALPLPLPLPLCCAALECAQGIHHAILGEKSTAENRQLEFSVCCTSERRKNQLEVKKTNEKLQKNRKLCGNLQVKIE